MSTQITAAEAKVMIERYHQDLPAGEMKSAWLNRDILDAVLQLEDEHQIDGIRVYLGKKSDESLTVILVLTEKTESAERKDIASAYYDYSSLCPPDCVADAYN